MEFVWRGLFRIPYYSYKMFTISNSYLLWQIYYEGDEVVMAKNTEENVMEHNDIGKLCEERCKTEVEESMPETSTAFKGASARLHRGIKVILSSLKINTGESSPRGLLYIRQRRARSVRFILQSFLFRNHLKPSI